MGKEKLIQVVVILSELRLLLKIKIKTRQIRQGKTREIRIVFKTVFIAKVVLERDDMLLPIDSRVMFLQPVYTKDNWVALDTSHFQGEVLAMPFSDREFKGGFLDNRTGTAWIAVSHV
jgi:hypothetical protein